MKAEMKLRLSKEHKLVQKCTFLCVLVFASVAIAAPFDVGPKSSAAAANSDSTCSVAKLLTDSRLKHFSGLVENAADGTVLFDRESKTVVAPASVEKVITSFVATLALGPSFTVRTHTYLGTGSQNANTLYLVGGGDPTLSRLPGLRLTVYKNPARLSALAEATVSRLKALSRNGQQINGHKLADINRIVLDSTAFTGPNFDPVWNINSALNGSVSKIVALQTDAGRLDPTYEYSARATDPVSQAGQAFLAALKRAGLPNTATLRVSLGTLPSRVAQQSQATSVISLASVKSSKIKTWMQDSLEISDNVEAEALGRLIAKQEGLPAAQTSIDAAYKKVFARVGINTAAQNFADGSGVSTKVQLSPEFVIKVLSFINQHRTQFKDLIAGLPISGRTGTLEGRFGGSNADAIGKVQAKTGYTIRTNSLAGFISAKDGSTLIFAIFSTDKTAVNPNARLALYNLATGFYRCGANLSNN